MDEEVSKVKGGTMKKAQKKSWLEMLEDGKVLEYYLDKYTVKRVLVPTVRLRNIHYNNN